MVEVSDHGLDHVGVRNDQHASATVLPRQTLELGDRAVLYFEKQFAIGNARRAALVIETMPAFVVREFVQGLASPLAEVDLIERGTQLHLEIGSTSDRFRCLACAFERTAVDRVGLHILQLSSKSLRLRAAFSVQTDSRRAAPDHLAETVAGSVSDQEESRHAIAPAVCAPACVVAVVCMTSATYSSS